MESFRPSNLSEVVYLQRNKKTFWEIKFDGNLMQTTIRCGQLQENGKEDQEKVLILHRTHNSVRTVIDYIAERVTIKLHKGYKIKEELSTSSQQFAQYLALDENLGKRKNTYNENQDSQPIKKVHTAVNNYKTLPPSQNKTKIEEKEGVNSSDLSTIGNNIKLPQHKQNISFAQSQKNSNSKIKIENTKEIAFGYSDKRGTDGVKEEIQLQQNQPFGNLTIIKPNKVPFEENKLQNTLHDRIEPITSYNSDKNSSLKTGIQAENNNFRKNDLEKREAEFKRKLLNLSESESPFGYPEFNIQKKFSIPSKWGNENPTGWYLSEKLDGVRCIWDGFDMYSTTDEIYDIPSYFIENLPKSPLDGVFYRGKGRLAQSESIVKKKSDNAEWNDLIFVVYDAPGLKESFKERHDKLKKFFYNRAYVRFHDYIVCKGMDHANQKFIEIKNSGGKGMILTDPQYSYICGESNSLLEKQTQVSSKSVSEIIDEQ